MKKTILAALTATLLSCAVFTAGAAQAGPKTDKDTEAVTEAAAKTDEKAASKIGAKSSAEAAAEATTEADTEAAATVTDTLTSIFRDINDMESGTAGSALSTARIAGRLLSFAGEYQFTSEEKDGVNADLAFSIVDALLNLDTADLSKVEENYKIAAEFADRAVKDYDSVRDTFDDAGIRDEMDTLLKESSDLPVYWNTLDKSIRSIFQELNTKVYAASDSVEATAVTEES